jgi:hypothetical protein
VAVKVDEEKDITTDDTDDTDSRCDFKVADSEVMGSGLN